MIKFFLKFYTNIIILVLFILSLSISLVHSSELKDYNGALNNYLMYCNKPKWDSLKKTYDYNLYKLTEYVTISKYTLQKREKGKWISFCKEIEFYKHTAICSKDYKFTKDNAIRALDTILLLSQNFNNQEVIKKIKDMKNNIIKT